MDMSVNPDGMDSTDYSDFEYQTISAEILAGEDADTTGDGSVLIRTIFESDVLDDVGGLDNNEVAELVYMEVHASVFYFDQSTDQNVGTSGQIRGAVGVNLPDSLSAFPSIRESGTEGSFISVDDIAEANVTLNGNGGSDDRWLQIFQANGSPSFDDETSGPGGGASSDSFYAEKPYRNLTGRGPVLDSNDTVTIPIELSTGDTIINFEGRVRVHMVWDIAETSDAGRRFSVPMDD